MTTATALARHLLAQWRVWGVEHVVLCPGSRSAPLAFAAWEAAGGSEGSYGFPTAHVTDNGDGTATGSFEGGVITA